MTIETSEQILASDVARTFTKAASDALQNSNDTERTTSGTSYTKVKEIKVNEAYSGTMRVKFDMHASGYGHAWGKVYKNGVAIGTERVTTADTYKTWAEDFSLTLVANDLIQIYGKKESGYGNTYFQNMRLCYSNKMTAIGEDVIETEILVTCSAISTTNQDP